MCACVHERSCAWNQIWSEGIRSGNQELDLEFRKLGRLKTGRGGGVLDPILITITLMGIRLFECVRVAPWVWAHECVCVHAGVRKTKHQVGLGLEREFKRLAWLEELDLDGGVCVWTSMPGFEDLDLKLRI